MRYVIRCALALLLMYQNCANTLRYSVVSREQQHHHHHRDAKRSASASRRSDRSSERSVLRQLQGLGRCYTRVAANLVGPGWSMVDHRHVSNRVKAAHHPGAREHIWQVHVWQLPDH